MADGAYGEYAYGDAEAVATVTNTNIGGAIGSAPIGFQPVGATTPPVTASIGVGSAAGTSTVSGVGVTPGVASAAGTSTVSAVGVAAGQGVGSASGSSTAAATVDPNRYGYGLASGSSTAIAVSPVKTRFIGAGSSAASAVGFANPAHILPHFAGAQDQVPSPMFCSRIRPSNFTPGSSGSYEYNPTPSNNHCNPAPVPPPDPFPPLVYTWRASIQHARVVDLNAAGNLILIGQGGSLFSGDSSIYLSPDTGANWIKLAVPPDAWVNVTMNAAGNLMAAYPLDTQYTYSSFDAGASWVASPRPWTTNQTNGVEIAKDGSRTILTANPGNNVYLSDSNGISWQAKDTGLLPWYEFFTCCCVSFNNSVMFAGRGLDKMYRSLNGGGHWEVCANSFASQFSRVACDWTGNYVVATASGPTLWFEVSRDAGLTWTKYTTQGWTACAVSGNGRVMAVARYGGTLMVSTDFGLTWTTQNVDGINGTYLWTDIGINYDGTVIVACAVDGPLYIGFA